MDSAKRKRPNKPAATRRAQAGLAQARAVQQLLFTLHRGCKPTRIGAALHRALGIPADANAKYDEMIELSSAALSDLAET